MRLKCRIRQWLKLALDTAARSYIPRRGHHRRSNKVELLETRALLATFSVTNLNDSGIGSLRDAISQANSSGGADEITFATSGTITLTTGQMEIKDSLTITGRGAATTVIDAQQNSRIFEITKTAGDVTLTRLGLRNGRTTGSNANFADSTFNGGAVRSLSLGNLTIRQSTLSGNSTTGDRAYGGALFADHGPVTLSQSTLSGNFTVGYQAVGGAICSGTGHLTLSQSNFSENFTVGVGAQGGAIFAGAGNVTLSQSTLSGNSTTGNSSDGGGVHASSGNVTLSQSTLSGNSATGYFARGGAIFTNSGSLTLSQSTLSGNRVTGTESDGGGLWFDNSAVTIVNSTITGNSATRAGGGLGMFADSFDKKLTIENSIIAGNTAGSNPDFTAPTTPATKLEVRFNIIGNSTGTTLTPSAMADANGNFIGGNTDATKVNPKLAPLADNGGPTQTHALMAGSPAIDHGSNAAAVDVTQVGSPALTTDQRGNPIARIFNTTVDMGAFELFTMAGPIVVSTTADELNGDISNGDLSLREAILLANSSSGANTITFAAGLTGSITLVSGQMVISETLTITGNGAASTVIDAQQNSRIFDITDTAGDVTLNKLGLQNGRTIGYNANSEDSTFNGGAVRSQSPGTLAINQSTLSGNSTTGDEAQGGAISVRSGNLALSQSTISGNSTSGYFAQGGAISANSGNVTLSQSTLSGNFTAGSRAQGGAVSAELGDVTLSQTTLSGNSTTGFRAYGGAIFAYNGAVTLSQSTVSGNSTMGYLGFGGAIYTGSGDVKLSQSTISGNSTKGYLARGGAISAGSGNVTLSQSTLTLNGAAQGMGGAIYSFSSAMTIRNSIVAGNTDGNGASDIRKSPDGDDAFTVTNSLIGRSNGTGLTATVGTTPDANGNFIGGDADATKFNPQLGPLANNGGPTQTHALLTGSPAIDRGSNAAAIDVTNGNAALTTDERGVPYTRILDGDHLAAATVDMGAYEFSGLQVISPNPNAVTLRPTFTWTPIAGATSYNIHINNESTGVAQFHLGTSNSTTYTPNVDLAIGKFKMWVRPNFGAVPGNWSAPHLFNNLTPPAWQSIPRTQLTSRPTLSWDALPGAAKYDLWVNNFSTGQQQVIRQDITGTSFTPSADLPMGIYRFWIRGIDAKGNFAGWSVLQEALVVPATTPVGPLGATFDRTPTFTWNSVAGAASYELYVKNQNTGAMVINGTSTTATNFTPVANLPDGPYRWWTFAVSQAFSTGAIKSGGSNPVDIYIGGRPTIIAPVAGSSTSDRTPTFMWSAVDGAASYQLFVSRIDVPQGGIINQVALTATSFTPVADLPAGTYRAWVRAVGSTNELSPWSIEVNFTITAVVPTPDSLDADLMLTGLLMSELAQGKDPDVNTHPARVVDHTQPDWIFDEANVERAAPERFSRPLAPPTIDDQQSDLFELDRLMMEFSIHQFLPGER